jgi:hypothetical protein
VVASVVVHFDTDCLVVASVVVHFDTDCLVVAPFVGAYPVVAFVLAAASSAASSVPLRAASDHQNPVDLVGAYPVAGVGIAG